MLQNPRATIQGFCNFVGMPFLEESLHWQSLDENSNIQELWHDNKNKEVALHWHQEAMFSQGFQKPKEYLLDANDQPLFTEIDNVEHRKQCMQVYEQYNKMYCLLRDDSAIAFT